MFAAINLLVNRNWDIYRQYDLHQSVLGALIAPRKISFFSLALAEYHKRAALRHVFASELGRGDCKPMRRFFDISRAAAPEAATSFWLLSAS
jgi:hypothetical protein